MTRVAVHMVPPAENSGLQPLPPPMHADTERAARWPLRDFREFRALPAAVPRARLHTRHLLRTWQLTGLAESAELVVSELLTNAVEASRPGDDRLAIRLWLLSDAARLLILAWDTSPQPPLPACTSHDLENGRGLRLVAAVCTRWDWYPTPGLSGKAVWALCER